MVKVMAMAIILIKIIVMIMILMIMTAEGMVAKIQRWRHKLRRRADEQTNVEESNRQMLRR